MTEKNGLTKKDNEATLKAFIDSIQETLINNDKVQLIGFGTFEVKCREARKGVNPRTREQIDIPASNTVAFKVGKEQKESINK